MYKKGFTLIEMLIVIVIIGILSAALIPRLLGIQARARDTARDADLRNISTAMELYHVDNGIYPSALYNTPITLSPNHIAWSEILVPSVVAQSQGSTIAVIQGQIGQYLKSIPQDPRGAGVAAASNGNCIDAGSSYGYASSGGARFSVTARSESEKGNTNTCGDTIDSNNKGGYKKQGFGLKTDIRDNPNYPGPGQRTPAYNFGFNNGIINQYSGSNGIDVVIPMEIDGIPVIGIGERALYNRQLTSIIIPDSVTSIGHQSFLYNQLTSITIPDSVTSIGPAAFQNNKLTSVIIPNSVTSIGDRAFYSNKLTSITIPDSVTSIPRGGFYGNELTSITIPDSVTSIGSAAFYSNKLTSITIPDSVISIEDRAFTDNNLTSITIPDSVTSIGVYAFSNNGPNRNSGNITNFVPGTYQTRNLVGNTWIKQ